MTKHMPMAEAIRQANVLMKDPNVTIFQMAECEHCGAEIMYPEPNMFYTVATCSMCFHQMDIERVGCYFTVVVGDTKKVAEAAAFFGGAGEPQGKPS